jgi:NAD(P)-dependent dehydrogenase (short-subunit alcohol dehydrogenase family)
VKSILVIGASRGIGLEFVRQYRAAGDRVIATARDPAGLQQLSALGATALQVDVAAEGGIADLAAQLGGQPIDVALYVAGVFPPPDARAPPDRAAFDQAMHVNVLGAMQAIARIAPLVEAASTNTGLGCLACITSAMGHIASVKASNAWAYRVSKAALNMAVASAQSSYPQAILIALSPGWVQTDMGGAGAPLTVEQSVSGMRKTLGALTVQHQGAYLDYDGRQFDGW